MLLGAIEAGGTKFVCGVGDPWTGSVETATIPTRDPERTFADIEAFFRGASSSGGGLAAVGIGSFGPVDIDPASPGYGQILRTPKRDWEGANILTRTAAILPAIPLALDTDVNAAALAEAAAAGPHVTQLAYVTVGTGIGVGIVIDGRPVHGLGHPESGHIIPRRHEAHGDFPGICPFHGDCLEGLASGPAVEAAWGVSPSQLPDDHPFWEIQSHYLAQLCATLFLTVAPMRIVLGGGVMKHQRLLPTIREKTAHLLAGYLSSISGFPAIETRIVPPACTEPSGLIGAYLLAERAAAKGP